MNPIVKRVVIKLGTEMLLSNGRLSQCVFDNVASQIMRVQELGVEVVIVTSGAIKAGMEMMKLRRSEVEEKLKPLLAGVGNPRLFSLWGNAFIKKPIAQILVTHANLRRSPWKGGLHTRILTAFARGIIPIINANDVVFPEEIVSMDKKISENDRLARMVAELIHADGILFLTKCGGVHEGDRKTMSEARCYKAIDVGNARAIADSASTKSTNGNGGISAKLRSAIKCSQKGMRTVIAGHSKNVVHSFVTGQPVGTRFGNSVCFW